MYRVASIYRTSCARYTPFNAYGKNYAPYGQENRIHASKIKACRKFFGELSFTKREEWTTSFYPLDESTTRKINKISNLHSRITSPHTNTISSVSCLV